MATATTTTDTSGKLSPLPPLKQFKTLTAAPPPQRAPAVPNAGFYIPSPKSMIGVKIVDGDDDVFFLQRPQGLW